MPSRAPGPHHDPAPEPAIHNDQHPDTTPTPPPAPGPDSPDDTPTTRINEPAPETGPHHPEDLRRESGPDNNNDTHTTQDQDGEPFPSPGPDPADGPAHPEDALLPTPLDTSDQNPAAGTIGTTLTTLPAVYTHDRLTQHFAHAITTMLQPCSDALDTLPTHLDPWTAPPHWLDWLTHITHAPTHPALPDAARRAAIQQAATLTATQGTHPALEQALALHHAWITPHPPHIHTPHDPPPSPHAPLQIAAHLPGPPTGTTVTELTQRLTQILHNHAPTGLPHHTTLYQPLTHLDAAINRMCKGNREFLFFTGPWTIRCDTHGQPIGNPVLIADVWPDLPSEFHTGIDTAVVWKENNGYLLKGGRSAEVTLSKPTHNKLLGMHSVRHDWSWKCNEKSPCFDYDIDAVASSWGTSRAEVRIFKEDSCLHYNTDKPKKTDRNIYTSLPVEFKSRLDATMTDITDKDHHYLFRGPHLVQARAWKCGSRQKITDIFPGLTHTPIPPLTGRPYTHIDAAAVRTCQGQKEFLFFFGPWIIRCHYTTGQQIGPTLTIQEMWPSIPHHYTHGIDAAMSYQRNYFWLFKGGRCIKAYTEDPVKNITDDVDSDPKGVWETPAGFECDLDAVLTHPTHDIGGDQFIKGGRTFNQKTKTVDDISKRFTGLHPSFTKGIDAITPDIDECYRAYLFRGNNFINYYSECGPVQEIAVRFPGISHMLS